MLEEKPNTQPSEPKQPNKPEPHDAPQPESEELLRKVEHLEVLNI